MTVRQPVGQIITTSTNQFGRGDIRQLACTDVKQLTEELLKSPDSKPSHWWLNNRLIRYENAACNLGNNEATEDPVAITTTPFPFTSTPSIKSHVAYVWNKLFTYSAPLSEAQVRLTGTLNSNKKELIEWVSCAIDSHSTELQRENLHDTFTALHFLLDQFTVNFENGLAKQQSLTSFRLLYSTVGNLEHIQCSLMWINSLPSYKMDDPSASLYKVFHTVLKGMPKSELNTFGISADALPIIATPSSSESFEADFEHLVGAFVSIGLDESEVRHIIELIFVIFYISLVSCEEREGKLLLRGEKNLSMAAQLLQVDAAALKNTLILNVKYSGGHKLTEGYRTASEVNKCRNKFISVLYSFILGFIISSANKQAKSLEICSKSVNLLMTPSVSFENLFQSASIATRVSPCGFSGFARNFLADFFIELYSENTEERITMRPEGVLLNPQGKTAASLLQLSEPGKKSESFIDKLLMGFGKKFSEKALFDWIKKWSKINSKIKIAKKRHDIFIMWLFDSPMFPIEYSLPDVYMSTLTAHHPEFVEIIKTSKTDIFTDIVSSGLECISDFNALVQSIFKERELISRNSPFFMYTFSGDSRLPLSHQLQMYRIPDLMSNDDYCEKLPHQAFLSKYACLGMNAYSQPPEHCSAASEFVIHKLKLLGAKAGVNELFVNPGHIFTLESRLNRYHWAILTLQCYNRRWRAFKAFRDLHARADGYKLFASEVILGYSARLFEFQEFCKYSYFHDLERKDCSLLQDLHEKVKKQTPKDSTFWASLIMMENDRPVYLTVLQNDVTLINGAQEKNGENHLPLGKLTSSLESEEAKHALEKLHPGLIIEMQKDYSVSLTGKVQEPIKVCVWGHWMNFGRNYAGGLKKRHGLVEDKTTTQLFLADDYKRSIAESIITQEVNLDQLDLECLIPLVVSGHTNSLHDSPLWLLLIHYGPMEALKTPEMQRDVRTMVANLVALGDTGTGRAWSKIHFQRDLYSADTDLRSQLQIIAKKREDGGVDEDRKELLRELDSSKERRGFNQIPGGKLWSKQVYQNKLYYLKKDKK